MNCRASSLGIAALLIAPAFGAGWIDLSKGTTLEGWRVEGKGNWKVGGGVIGATQSAGNVGGDIFTGREWGNFETELEFQMSSPGNSGLWFRVSKEQPGYQVDFIDEKGWPGVYSGSLYCMGKAFIAKNTDAATIRKAGWNKVRLRVEGDHIVVVMNGKTVIDIRDNTFPKAGSLGLQVHSGKSIDGMSVRVRKFRVREL
jgi:hypothetical protein